METINVAGKPVKLASGGQVYFQVQECRGALSSFSFLYNLQIIQVNIWNDECSS